MKVKFLATIYADINVYPDEFINSDTIGDYKAQLDCDLVNAALGHIVNIKAEDVIIETAEPYDEGIDEYGKLLEDWYESKKL